MGEYYLETALLESLKQQPLLLLVFHFVKSSALVQPMAVDTVWRWSKPLNFLLIGAVTWPDTRTDRSWACVTAV